MVSKITVLALLHNRKDFYHVTYASTYCTKFFMSDNPQQSEKNVGTINSLPPPLGLISLNVKKSNNKPKLESF